MDIVLFLGGVSSCLAMLCAIFRVRHPAVLAFPIMMTGWLVGDFALVHLAGQVAATGLLVALGGLDSQWGWYGLLAMIISWVGLVRAHVVALSVRAHVAEEMGDVLGPTVADEIANARPERDALLRPFHPPRRGVEIIRDVAYGSGRRNKLDIYRSPDGGSNRPVVLYLHGGGWITGKKEQQARPMLHALARAGYIAITTHYGLAPKSRLPGPLEDVALALDWVRDNGAGYGADPDFVVISGGSAGGHLASLAALGAVGPRVNGCIPIYGCYDFTDHLGIRGYASLRPFLELLVVATKEDDDPDGWKALSPIHLVHEKAPPFLVIHGTLDVMLWKEETRAFVERLRAVSTSPVSYLEVPGAQHAFDIGYTVRSAPVIEAIVAYVDALVQEANTSTNR